VFVIGLAFALLVASCGGSGSPGVAKLGKSHRGDIESEAR
jgi:hypothetical protein